MKIETLYSHKDGQTFIKRRHATELAEVHEAISQADAVYCLRKQSEEKTKPPLLFSPPALNNQIKGRLHEAGWATPSPASKKGFREPRINFPGNQFREMDGIKNKCGLEVQFGKYAFMGYDILSKMVIFKNHGLIECGIEVVVVASMIREMSTGVSSFDQIVLDLKERGESDLDIPVLIIGICPTKNELAKCQEKRRRFLKDPAGMIQSGKVDAKRRGALPGPK